MCMYVYVHTYTICMYVCMYVHRYKVALLCTMYIVHNVHSTMYLVRVHRTTKRQSQGYILCTAIHSTYQQYLVRVQGTSYIVGLPYVQLYMQVVALLCSTDLQELYIVRVHTCSMSAMMSSACHAFAHTYRYRIVLCTLYYVRCTCAGVYTYDRS